jgi:hypothetical protein
MTVLSFGDSYVLDGLEFKVMEIYTFKDEEWVKLVHPETRTVTRRKRSFLEKKDKIVTLSKDGPG